MQRGRQPRALLAESGRTEPLRLADCLPEDVGRRYAAFLRRHGWTDAAVLMRFAMPIVDRMIAAMDIPPIDTSPPTEKPRCLKLGRPTKGTGDWQNCTKPRQHAGTCGRGDVIFEEAFRDVYPRSGEPTPSAERERREPGQPAETTTEQRRIY